MSQRNLTFVNPIVVDFIANTETINKDITFIDNINKTSPKVIIRNRLGKLSIIYFDPVTGAETESEVITQANNNDGVNLADPPLSITEDSGVLKMSLDIDSNDLKVENGNLMINYNSEYFDSSNGMFMLKHNDSITTFYDGIGVNIDSGLVLDNNGLTIDTADPLEVNYQKKLTMNYNSSLELDTSNKLSVNPGKGLIVNASGLEINASSIFNNSITNGLDLNLAAPLANTNNRLDIDYDASMGVINNRLAVRPKTDSCIVRTTGGLDINTMTPLETENNNLTVKYDDNTISLIGGALSVISNPDSAITTVDGLNINTTGPLETVSNALTLRTSNQFSVINNELTLNNNNVIGVNNPIIQTVNPTTNTTDIGLLINGNTMETSDLYGLNARTAVSGTFGDPSSGSSAGVLTAGLMNNMSGICSAYLNTNKPYKYIYIDSLMDPTESGQGTTTMLDLWNSIPDSNLVRVVIPSIGNLNERNSYNTPGPTNINIGPIIIRPSTSIMIDDWTGDHYIPIKLAVESSANAGFNARPVFTANWSISGDEYTNVGKDLTYNDIVASNTLYSPHYHEISLTPITIPLEHTAKLSSPPFDDGRTNDYTKYMILIGLRFTFNSGSTNWDPINSFGYVREVVLKLSHWIQNAF